MIFTVRNIGVFNCWMRRGKRKIIIFGADYFLTSSLTIWVPVWPDNWIICLVLANRSIDNLPNGYKICQKHIKILPNIESTLSNGQMFLTVCQSGEISPNLVTLNMTDLGMSVDSFIQNEYKNMINGSQRILLNGPIPTYFWLFYIFFSSNFEIIWKVIDVVLGDWTTG